MRQFFFPLHKYAGLTLGLLLSLIGLTGSLLVFDHALDEKLAPRTVDFKPSAQPASYSEVLAAAREAVPGSEPQRLMTPRGEGSPFVVRFPAPEGAPGPIEVSVSPTDAEVLAVRGWGEYTMTWIYRLHYTLLTGKTGKTVVGFVGLLLMLFCISGLVIWWPRRSRRGGRWKRAFTIKRDGNRFRFYFDLHKVAGIYFLPLLLLTAFSGVTLVFPQQVEAVVGTFLPTEPRPSLPRSRQDTGTPLNPDTIVEIGRGAFPGGELKRIYLPRDAGDSYGLSFRADGEPWRNYGASFVRLDQYSGKVLMVRDVTEIPPGNKVLRWQFPLHNGDALGLFGRWLVLFAGLMPALLFATGVYLWWKKRRPLRRARALKPANA
ncbi:PepSY-associated TM helix domain-containing protein [Microbulbifer halophilus]|uniref:PepSY-associated TM helix domain-containing protein n=1 Tax=Microbulbifer halophilus TaxID=453963 RepID=A0ABW5EH56_9GAMM|nr:PepSY-associated TM helix domain-containing protein [Microbulbifer halophilus]MCW8127777.1 PepSY-associated TM helix domain-containing protein [Microbulbifer halophilus]